MRCEPITDFSIRLGESPVWHNGLLYFADIDSARVFAYDPARRKCHIRQLPDEVGSLVPRAAGGLVLAMRDGFYAYDFATQRREPLASPVHRQRGVKFNDSKCDPCGRLYAGTTGPAGQAHLYVLQPDRRVQCLLGGVTISNGIAFSLDGRTLYYADTPTRRVDAFDYDRATGALSNRRTVIEVSRGLPDGMCLDGQGLLWVAQWGGGCVQRYDPATGAALERIDLPADLVSSCAFGGADLSTLFVTTARQPGQPGNGAVYALRPGVRGLPTACYRG